MKDGQVCGNCRFFHRHEEECRRRAPVPMLLLQFAAMEATAAQDAEAREITKGAGSHSVWWPEVRKEDWCGEYEPEVAA